LRELFYQYDIVYQEPFDSLCPPGPRTDEQYEDLEAVIRYFFLMKGNEEPLNYWARVGDPNGYGEVFRRACNVVREALEAVYRELSQEHSGLAALDAEQRRAQVSASDTEEGQTEAFASDAGADDESALWSDMSPATPTPRYVQVEAPGKSVIPADGVSSFCEGEIRSS
jgi:hypothetical protein